MKKSIFIVVFIIFLLPTLITFYLNFRIRLFKFVITIIKSDSYKKNKALINANIYYNMYRDMIMISVLSFVIFIIISLFLINRIPYIFYYIRNIKWEDMITSELFKIIIGSSGILGMTSIISSIYNIYSIKQNKKVGIKQQSNWRKQLIEIEQKNIDEYVMNDLFIINSFINPYSFRSSASHFINELIYNIYMQYYENIYDHSEIISVCRNQLNSMLKNGFPRIKFGSYHSLLLLSNEQLTNIDFDKRLTRKEALDIRLCCHVLMKAEWEQKL